MLPPLTTPSLFFLPFPISARYRVLTFFSFLLLPFPHSCYVLVAEAMALAGDLHSQQQLLAQMEAERVEVSAHFLGCIMDAQGQHPAWVNAEMRQRGVAQHMNMYETQLRMLIEKNLDRAMHVYREMRAQRLFPSEVVPLSPPPLLPSSPPPLLPSSPPPLLPSSPPPLLPSSPPPLLPSSLLPSYSPISIMTHSPYGSSQRVVTSLIHSLKRNDRVRDCKDILLDLDKAGMKLTVKVRAHPFFVFICLLLFSFICY